MQLLGAHRIRAAFPNYNMLISEGEGGEIE